MENEVCYMLCVVFAGFAVNYCLRALPFLLFAGRNRSLPTWVERLGGIVSPVIIASLIVYAYSGLAWRTAWPYLAGLITVALHLWRRNPLISIIAGTVLYMCMLSCGCATRRIVELDAQHTAIRVTSAGVLFGDDRVQPEEVPERLLDYGIPSDRVIHIRIDNDVRDLRQSRTLMNCLAKAGYTRPVLVTQRHGDSFATGKKAAKSAAPSTSGNTKIRYKKAQE